LICWPRRVPSLGEPCTKQLDGKLRELRFHLDEFAVRITYWIATGCRIVLLTVFHKTRSAVARFEAGGTIPTLPVLERLARALDADVEVRLTPRSPAA
jgi:transcriptional regulator with XRE-family HTH domain